MSTQYHSVNNEAIEFVSTKRRYSLGSGVKEEIDNEEMGVEYEYENFYTESEMDAGSEMDVGSEMMDDGSKNNAESEIDVELKNDVKPNKDVVLEKYVKPKKYCVPEYVEREKEDGPEEGDECSLTMTNQSYDECSINSATVSVRKLERLSSMLRDDAERSERTIPWPFVFEFDALVGELGPNERRDLRLSFRPTECLTYTVEATCYLTCDRNDYPEIFNALPVTIQGTGCKTRFQVSLKVVTINHRRAYKLLKYFFKTFERAIDTLFDIIFIIPIFSS